ncbi:MAG: phospholipase/carboxylesterase [Gemmatimonadaceae bacterium]|jgi:phospholipase/carboxylesterase|nr:phospholipase/carboxylesterase [Gemmatimonadaceae bacterium]
MTDDIGFIHRFVPAQDTSSAETLVVLHGTGGDENDLIGIGQAIAPGTNILSPRGNVLENGAPRFFKRLAEGKFDPIEVKSRGEELIRFIRAAISKYRLNPERVFALGYSNGANVASTMMFIEPELLRGAILLRPMVVFEPSERPDLSDAGILISAGRMDPIVPTTSVDRLAELFEASHAEVTLKWQLAGHNLLPSEVHEAADWLALQRARV